MRVFPQAEALRDPDIGVWLLVAAFFVVALAAFATAGIRVDGREALCTILPTLACAGVSVVALLRWPGHRFARITATFAQMGLCSFAMVMLAFSAARIGRPLVDHELLRFDRALGYHWEPFTRFVVAHPVLEAILAAGYESLFWQPLVVMVALAFDRDRLALNRYVTAYVLLMLVTLVVFALWPATTAWHHAGVSAAHIARHHLQNTTPWVETLRTVRSGVPIAVSSHISFAIVGFPSFHCAAAILNASAAAGNRWLRHPFVALNAVLITATPIDGGHYIADIAGAAVVTTCAVLATRWIYDRAARPQAVPVPVPVFAEPEPMRLAA